MRYADGGGLTARERVVRERVRGQAADMFERDVASTEIAAWLRVTPKSVRAWRRAWTVGGRAALASRGAGGARTKLDDAQLDRLVAELDRGPAVHGWTDQRWTLDRITLLVRRLFRVSYLLRRIGWSPQVPAPPRPPRSCPPGCPKARNAIANAWPRSAPSTTPT